jgi:hypothetical protein
MAKKIKKELSVSDLKKLDKKLKQKGHSGNVNMGELIQQSVIAPKKK